jgi:nucleoside-diphosphate-sugar epimerase
MKRVLVVGGAGYVGCVLVDELLAKGYAVRVLDRVFFGREPLEPLLDRIELVEADMRDFGEAHLKGCEAVINLGGLSNDPTAEFNPTANEELNTHATIRVAEVAKRAGARRLIVASTCSIYDRGVAEEGRDVLLDETSPVDPRAAYATSKLAAEQAILPMNDERFAVTALRKGTVFGFSPRMRYDLVVNTMVKDALSSGKMTIHYGGAMWRPLVDVRDIARAYVQCLEADREVVAGQIFNVSGGNFRISELALRVQRTLREAGVDVDLDVDYSYRLIRSYRVSNEKMARALGFEPRVSVEESVSNMVAEIERWGYTDFSHPRYYNIEWMKLLEEAVGIVSTHGYVLSKPEGVDTGRGAVRHLRAGGSSEAS